MKNQNNIIDMHQKPIKTKWYLQFLLYLAIPFTMLSYKHKIIKENFKKIKGGCLVVSNHMSFEDVKFLKRILNPRRAFFVTSVDEVVFKEKLVRNIGCIPKKVHYSDMFIVKQIVRLLKEGNIVALYPEATYSFAGITNMIDQDLGKLAKLANVPVVVIHEYGSYLYSPRWNTLPKNKEVPIIAKAKMVVSKEELASTSADEIQRRINEYFDYDEYKYQRENNIRIKNPTKAHNIERILFRCPNCEHEKTIHGEGNYIICSNCNSKYFIDELQILHNENGKTVFDSIGTWYSWQRNSVAKDLSEDNYHLEFPVKISRLINFKEGFDHNFAKGIARQDNHGIVVDGVINATNEPFHYEYNEKLNQTIHLTFDVKGCQESAFEVHDANESYLVYPLDGTSIVKIRFAVEEAHKLHIQSIQNK